MTGDSCWCACHSWQLLVTQFCSHVSKCCFGTLRRGKFLIEWRMKVILQKWIEFHRKFPVSTKMESNASPKRHLKHWSSFDSSQIMDRPHCACMCADPKLSVCSVILSVCPAWASALKLQLFSGCLFVHQSVCLSRHGVCDA